MANRFLPFVALALTLPAASALAQEDHFTTVPQGYDTTEGNSDSRDLIGTQPLLRYQQIDATATRGLLQRQEIAFRRDGRLPDNTSYGPRTIELEVVLAEGDLDTISTDFAANYQRNMSMVVARKSVSFDDWLFAPTVPPGDVSNAIFFDQLWDYSGVTASGNDLLWEIRVYSNDQAGQDYAFDFEYVVPNAKFGFPKVPTRGMGDSLSTGCTVPGQTNPLTASITILNDLQNMQWQSATWYGVAGAPVILLVDGQDWAAPLPTLCTTLHAVLASVPHGIADAAGHTSFGFTMPYRPRLVGQDLYVQAVTPDASQSGMPMALSNGLKVTVPSDPQDPVVGRVWALDPTASTATVGPLPGGIVLFTNHK
ncbi:MAG: hypothetical protein AAF628_04805 [Planctomycetota bacterium]